MTNERVTHERRSVLGVAALFALTGTAHFAVPGWFDQIVPPWIPDARAATLISGGAELAGAVGVLLPATRVAAGYGLILLLLAVFPANVHMLQMARDSNAALWYQAALWVRLPLQLLLMMWVWKAVIRGTTSTRA